MIYLDILLMFIIVVLAIVICRVKKRKIAWVCAILSIVVSGGFMYECFLVPYEVREFFLTLAMVMFIILIIDMLLIIFIDMDDKKGEEEK